MGFTAAATAILGELDKSVDYAFELRTGFAGSEEWQEYPFADFALTHDVNAPATLKVVLLNDDLDFSDEQSTTNRTQLLAEARLSCTIGQESEMLFQGRVSELTPKDYGFTLTAQ